MSCSSPTTRSLEVTVGRDAEEVRTSAIEAPRLAAEELCAGRPGAAHAAVVGALQRLPAARGAAATSRAAPECDVRRSAARPRPRCRRVGARPLPRALHSTPRPLPARRCARRGAEESEFALAGRAARGALRPRASSRSSCWSPGGERLLLHRHPLPTDRPAGPLARCSSSAGGATGLSASVTRMRAFTPLTSRRARALRGAARRRGRGASTRRGRARGSATSSPSVAAAYPTPRLRRRTSGTATTRAARPATRPATTSPTPRSRTSRRGPGVRLEPVGRRLQGRGHGRSRRAADVEILSPDPDWPGGRRPAGVSGPTCCPESAAATASGLLERRQVRHAGEGPACAPPDAAPPPRLARLDPERHRRDRPTRRWSARRSPQAAPTRRRRPRPRPPARRCARIVSFIAKRELARRPADAPLRLRRVRRATATHGAAAAPPRHPRPPGSGSTIPHRVLVEPSSSSGSGWPLTAGLISTSPATRSGTGQRGVEGERAAHRVADEPDRAVGGRVEHRDRGPRGACTAAACGGVSPNPRRS